MYFSACSNEKEIHLKNKNKTYYSNTYHQKEILWSKPFEMSETKAQFSFNEKMNYAFISRDR